MKRLFRLFRHLWNRKSPQYCQDCMFSARDVWHHGAELHHRIAVGESAVRMQLAQMEVECSQ